MNSADNSSSDEELGNEESLELLPMPEQSLKRKSGEENGDDFKRRRLMKELKMIRIARPTLDLDLISKYDDELNSLTTDELDNKVENARIAIGAHQPFAVGGALSFAIGQLVERGLGWDGFCSQITHSSEFLATIECATPISLSNYGSYIQTIASFISEINKYQSKCMDIGMTPQ